jgi:hypothetical protein
MFALQVKIGLPLLETPLLMSVRKLTFLKPKQFLFNILYDSTFLNIKILFVFQTDVFVRIYRVLKSAG